jgi:nucleoside-diphosphate-sugar epimerase
MHEILTLNRLDSTNSFLFELNDRNKNTLGDLRDQTFLNENNNIDVIVNALGDVTKTDMPENIEGLVYANSIIPAIVASRFGNSSIKFIQIGTFSHKSDLLHYQPQTFYAATKFAGENFLKYFSEKKDLSIVVFHTYDIYGENQPHNRLLRYLINSIQSRTKILTSPGEQEFTPIYIKDLVKNICSAISQDFQPNSNYIEFDAFGPETFKVRDLPVILSQYIGIPLESNQVEMKLPYTGKEIFKFNPYVQKLSHQQTAPQD